MILLLDIGNSAVKWAISAEDGVVSPTDSCVHREGGIGCVAAIHWQGMSPTRVVASNVAGEVLAQELCAWVRVAWQVEVLFLCPEAQAFGVRNAYRDPSRLGADRWAALIGAARRPHGHLCVVDCGTAVTLDALTADNVHLGGLIVPGLRLMRDALVVGTAGVRFTKSAEEMLLGCDTGSAVVGGTLYAVVALIERVVAHLAVELSGAVTVLLTGGDAATVLPLLSSTVEYEPDLVIHGLAVVAKTT